MPTTVLLTHDDILRRTREMAAEIRRDYAAVGQLHIVCVLKGAFMFLADLVRAMDMTVTLDFMALSSYAKATTSSGEVRLLKDLDSALEGRHVLIVEDIVDTGLTLHYLQEILTARGPKSVRTDFGPDRVPPEQAVAAPHRGPGGVYRIHDRGPVRGRIRARFRRPLPQPAVHCRARYNRGAQRVRGPD